MPRPCPSTKNCWTTKPGFCGTGRRIPACWRFWRTLTRPWPGRGPGHPLPGPLHPQTGGEGPGHSAGILRRGEELALSYQTVRTVTDPLGPTVTLYETLREHQNSHRRAELEAKSCLSGPHKDDLLAAINGQPALSSLPPRGRPGPPLCPSNWPSGRSFRRTPASGPSSCWTMCSQSWISAGRTLSWEGSPAGRCSSPAASLRRRDVSRKQPAHCPRYPDRCWGGRRFGLNPRNTLHSREDS